MGKRVGIGVGDSVVGAAVGMGVGEGVAGQKAFLDFEIESIEHPRSGVAPFGQPQSTSLNEKSPPSHFEKGLESSQSKTTLNVVVISLLPKVLR